MPMRTIYDTPVEEAEETAEETADETEKSYATN